MNRIEIVIGSNKTIDMKDVQQFTYDIISSENDNEKIKELLEQYANQRVIEELEKLVNLKRLPNGTIEHSPYISTEKIVDLIEELKQ